MSVVCDREDFMMCVGVDDITFNNLLVEFSQYITHVQVVNTNSFA